MKKGEKFGNSVSLTQENSEALRYYRAFQNHAKCNRSYFDSHCFVLFHIWDENILRTNFHHNTINWSSWLLFSFAIIQGRDHHFRNILSCTHVEISGGRAASSERLKFKKIVFSLKTISHGLLHIEIYILSVVTDVFVIWLWQGSRLLNHRKRTVFPKKHCE